MKHTHKYSELNDELEKVMADLERGDLDIDEAVRCYERGLTIVRELETYLKEAENKVTELKATLGGTFSDDESEDEEDAEFAAGSEEE